MEVDEEGDEGVEKGPPVKAAGRKEGEEAGDSLEVWEIIMLAPESGTQRVGWT